MIIEGAQTPAGKVTVSGAKNSATRLLAAALTSSETVRIRNFPTRLVDAVAKMRFMRDLGADIEVDDAGSSVEILTRNLQLKPDLDFNVPIRTTYLLAAGQLARNGKARIPYPGGCKIGNRGYDLHIMVWRALGCQVTEEADCIYIQGHLRGNLIDFPISTVGGTENALICAAVALGDTEIRNAYVSPEVHDLILLLREMGAQIDDFGNSLIRVRGCGGLLRGASFQVMPDRIEALTWIIFGVLTGGEILVEGVPFEHMQVPLLHLQDAGIDIFRSSHRVYINANCVAAAGIQPFELACGTHPGVISDMQSFYTLLGMKAKGTSRIYDYRYPERIAYARELDKFAPGSVESEPGKITTRGMKPLKGARVKSTDLRGSMALVMSAFCAEGESYVEGVDLALRGYNDLAGKLQSLGLKFQVIEV
ncbi:MAG TPA: UDP-N-acetylglucosamine 1-carboxyvinyltransferase [Dongiaceae bacterium]|nr:UDP-N-acetylglucosamine 1-carboxyvinyltransferase [Dongiaceae bacterium]